MDAPKVIYSLITVQSDGTEAEQPFRTDDTQKLVDFTLSAVRQGLTVRVTEDEDDRLTRQVYEEDISSIEAERMEQMMGLDTMRGCEEANGDHDDTPEQDEPYEPDVQDEPSEPDTPDSDDF